jgi:hypothetical protein
LQRNHATGITNQPRNIKILKPYTACKGMNKYLSVKHREVSTTKKIENINE